MIRLQSLLQRTTLPLVSFFRRLQLWKVLMREDFPAYFRRAIELALLHEFGGVLLSGCMLKEHLPDALFDKSSFWYAPHAPNNYAIFSRPNAKFLENMMQDFMHEISDLYGIETDVESCEETKYPSIGFDQYFEYAAHPSSEKHYAVFWYDTRVAVEASNGGTTSNLGDEIQSLASVNWLPYIDVKVERDNLTSIDGQGYPRQSVTTFMNAWFGWRGMKWPPPPAIKPILVAMHIEPNVESIFQSASSVSYLGSHGSVGARDTATKNTLSKMGLDAYFSGCMTLTMQNLGSNGSKRCKYIIVEIAKGAYEKFPQSILSSNQMCQFSHRTRGPRRFVAENRFLEAFELLEIYSSASVLITSRLHAALPAASMGLTVILVKTSVMPGGGPGVGNGRFSGLEDLVHAIPVNDIESKMADFDWEHPPENPGKDVIQRIRCKLYSNILRYHPDLEDSIRFFDTSGIWKDCQLVIDNNLN